MGKNNISRSNTTPFRYAVWSVGVSLSLYLLSRYNYLLFHSMAETFIISVAAGTFMVAWHTRNYSHNGFMLFIGIAYLFIGAIDSIHTLSYSGMNILRSNEFNIATQFWISARILQSISLAAAPLFLKRRLKTNIVLHIYSFIFILIVFSILWWDIFPECMNKDTGLTQFKVISEYIVSILFGVSLFVLYRKRSLLEKSTFRLISTSIVLTILSELSFTLYHDPYGFANMFGHLLKIFAFFIIYRAIIADTLEKPYSILFRNLTGTNRKLRASEEHFRTIFELSGVARAETKPEDGRFTRVNQRLCDISGYSRKELLHMSYYELVHPENREDVRNKARQFLKSGEKTWNMVERIITKSGVTKWVSFFSSIIYESSGNPFRIIADIADVTEEHDIKEELSSKIERQTSALSHTKNSLVKISEEKIDAEKKLSLRHQALEEVYAMVTSFDSSTEEIFDQVAMSIFNIIKARLISVFRLQEGKTEYVSYCYNGELAHKTGQSIPCSFCKSAVRKGRPYQFTGDIRKSFGERRCLNKDNYRSYLGVPIIDYEGRVSGMICLLTLEERVFPEHEVHLVEIFSRYVAYEISKKTMEKQILQSHEMKLLGQLTSGVAHEVRNPLNALLAVTEALFKRIENNEEYSQYIKHIKNQINRLSRLMRDLLALGRPLREEDSEEIKIAALIRETVSNWVRLSEDRTGIVDINVHSEAENSRIHVDVTKMEQVFTNLLDNAAQNMKEMGKITVSILNTDNDSVSVKISDNGPGIAENDLKHIFEPFYTKRKGGTGLGLSIVKNTIENHGGQINIFNNVLPPGLTVEITLSVV